MSRSGAGKVKGGTAYSSAACAAERGIWYQQSVNPLLLCRLPCHCTVSLLLVTVLSFLQIFIVDGWFYGSMPTNEIVPKVWLFRNNLGDSQKITRINKFLGQTDRQGKRGRPAMFGFCIPSRHRISLPGKQNRAANSSPPPRNFWRQFSVGGERENQISFRLEV